MKKKIAMLLVVACILTVPASAAYMVDVGVNDWSYTYASYMVDYEIMQLEFGYFNPSVFTSRGEFVLYLWRAAGSPAVSAKSATFTDVPRSSDYFPAVEWALSNGVTTGTSDTEFSPYLLLTRETAFTFLYRALPLFGYSTEGLTGRYINGFEDAEHVSSWAFEAMNALCALGIVNGEDGYLMPGRDVANAETAAIIYRTLELAGALSDVPPDYIAEFAVYNETETDIFAVNVMPAFSDGEGFDILPYILEPGGSHYAEFTKSFVYADATEWKLTITDMEGNVTLVSQSFRPADLLYMDIVWDSARGDYGCEFVY